MHERRRRKKERKKKWGNNAMLGVKQHQNTAHKQERLRLAWQVSRLC
jgi:hypothetical protein